MDTTKLLEELKERLTAYVNTLDIDEGHYSEEFYDEYDIDGVFIAVNFSVDGYKERWKGDYLVPDSYKEEYAITIAKAEVWEEEEKTELSNITFKF